MPLPADIRAFYTATGPMTDLGRHAAAARALPRDLAALCAVVQGDLVHHHWAGAYKVELTPAKAMQQHLRGTAATLDVLLANNPAPLGDRREPADRAVGVCRHFSVVTAAILRAQGVPARARVGFGAYFEPGKFVDHWVVEHWSEARRPLGADRRPARRPATPGAEDRLRPARRPRDRFIIAGDAWAQCRAGKADPIEVRHLRHVGPVVHRRQRDARLRGAEQRRDAALGLLGRRPGARTRRCPTSSSACSTAWPP